MFFILIKRLVHSHGLMNTVRIAHVFRNTALIMELS
jgi:hypothetical protein